MDCLDSFKYGMAKQNIKGLELVIVHYGRFLFFPPCSLRLIFSSCFLVILCGLKRVELLQLAVSKFLDIIIWLGFQWKKIMFLQLAWVVTVPQAKLVSQIWPSRDAVQLRVSCLQPQLPLRPQKQQHPQLPVRGRNTNSIICFFSHALSCDIL